MEVSRVKIILTMLLTIGVIVGLTIPTYAVGVDSKYSDTALLAKATEIVNEQFSDVDPDSPKYAWLIAETYEKYDVSKPAVSALAATVASDDEADEANGVDTAYTAFLERIQYIVDTINSFGEDTNEENTEFNRDYLVENYDKISEIDGVNLLLIDWYIGEATAALEVRDMPTSATRPSARAYSATAAVDYAKKYYKTYNSAYPDWSDYGDCANFISQCVHAGGKPYNISEANTTKTKSDDYSNWYSYGTGLNTTKVSATHRGANPFRTYWLSKVSFNNFLKLNVEAYNYGVKGDAVSLINPVSGLAYHTLLIIGYDTSAKDFIVATHTNDTMTSTLGQYVNAIGDPFVIYRMS